MSNNSLLRAAVCALLCVNLAACAKKSSPAPAPSAAAPDNLPATLPPAGATATAALPSAGTASTAAVPDEVTPLAGADRIGEHLGGTSERGLFNVGIEFGLPKVGELFSVEVTVTDAKGGATPAETQVKLDATMPEHGHGMMTEPKVTALGNGKWRIDGMKLHMHGKWVFSTTVTAGDRQDVAKFNHEQPPTAAAGL